VGSPKPIRGRYDQVKESGTAARKLEIFVLRWVHFEHFRVHDDVVTAKQPRIWACGPTIVLGLYTVGFIGTTMSTDDWWASALPQLEAHSYPQHVRSGNRSGPKIESAER